MSVLENFCRYLPLLGKMLQLLEQMVYLTRGTIDMIEHSININIESPGVREGRQLKELAHVLSMQETPIQFMAPHKLYYGWSDCCFFFS